MSDPASSAPGGAPRRTTRRDILRPVQLLGFAFAAAAFGGLVTLVSLGFFQDLSDDERGHVIVVSLIAAGVAFIATLVVIALLMLAIDPAQVTRPVDRPVLLPPGDSTGDATGDGSADGAASPDPDRR